LPPWNAAPKDGCPKILKKWTLPLAGVRVVETIATRTARIRVTPQGLVLMEIAAGVSVEEVRRASSIIMREVILRRYYRRTPE